VLISGGSRGIGLAAARRFLAEGARVHLGGHEAAGVKDALDALGGNGVGGTVCDVSKVDHVDRLMSEATDSLGGIDVLANNAGTCWREPFLDITPEHWDRIIEVNLRGMFLVGQAAARHMVERGGGAIVNMASTNALGAEADYAQRLQGRRRAAHPHDGCRARPARCARQRAVPRLHRHSPQPRDCRRARGPVVRRRLRA
jgi:NAD(P)-dependent dehydrogenase (short-subunit alcohol dehydrogenase family)